MCVCKKPRQKAYVCFFGLMFFGFQGGGFFLAGPFLLASARCVGAAGRPSMLAPPLL